MIEESWCQTTNLQEDLQKQLTVAKEEKDKVDANRIALETKVIRSTAKILSLENQLRQVERQAMQLVDDAARRKKLLW